MNPWLVLLIIVIVIFVVWWAFLRNAKTYKPDFEMHEHSDEGHGHAEEEHAHEAEAPAAPEVEIKPEPETAQEEETVAEPEAVRAAEAAIATAPVQPDDLTMIEGIGPKINQLLHAAGIQTFAQLAKANPESLKAILETAGLRFIDPSSWTEQASLISEGKMDAFSELTSRLRGGRKVD